MVSKSSDKFAVYPLVPLADGTHSIADRTLVYIWERLQEEGKVDQLFYDGSIKDIHGWLDFIKSPKVYPIIIWNGETKQIAHIAWLKDCFDSCAWVHHTAVGKYQRGVWEAARDFWRQFDSLKLLLGLTPKVNEKAVKFLTKICKFTIVGEVPFVCNMAYQGERSPGIISYFELGGESWAAAEKAGAAESHQ